MKLITTIIGAAGIHLASSNLLGSQWAHFNNYGCYCYFDSPELATVVAVGEPVNEFDNECRTLYQCYHATVQHQAELGESCEPWSVNYLSAAGLFLSSGMTDSLAACTQINEVQFNLGSCATQACVCELDFSFNMSNLTSQDIDANMPTYSHDNGFDTSAQCIDDSTTTSGPQDSTAVTTQDETGFVQQDGTIRLFGVDADQCLYRRGMKVLLGKCRAQHASQNWLWNHDSVTWSVKSLTAYGSEDLCMTRVPKNNRFVAGLAVCDDADTAQQFHYRQGRIHNGDGDNFCLGVSAVGLNKEKAISGKLGVAVEISRCVHTVWG